MVRVLHIEVTFQLNAGPFNSVLRADGVDRQLSV